MPELTEEQKTRAGIIFCWMMVFAVISSFSAIVAAELAAPLRTEDNHPLPKHCVHRTSPPAILGLIVALAHSIAHLIFTVEVGCIYRRHTPRPSISVRTLAVCVLSRVMFLGTLFVLLMGAVFGAKFPKKIFVTCYVANSDALGIGGGLSAISVCLAILGHDLFIYENSAISTRQVYPLNQAGIELV